MKWIKVEDRLPQKDEKCLIYVALDNRSSYWVGIMEATFSNNCGWQLTCSYFKLDHPIYVTHWMPIIDLPED